MCVCLLIRLGFKSELRSWEKFVRRRGKDPMANLTNSSNLETLHEKYCYLVSLHLDILYCLLDTWCNWSKWQIWKCLLSTFLRIASHNIQFSHTIF